MGPRLRPGRHCVAIGCRTVPAGGPRASIAGRVPHPLSMMVAPTPSSDHHPHPTRTSCLAPAHPHPPPHPTRRSSPSPAASSIHRVRAARSRCSRLAAPFGDDTVAILLDANAVASASSSSPERPIPMHIFRVIDVCIHARYTDIAGLILATSRPAATCRPPTGNGGSRPRCTATTAASSWSSGSSSASTSPALATSPASPASLGRPLTRVRMVLCGGRRRDRAARSGRITSPCAPDARRATGGGRQLADGGRALGSRRTGRRRRSARLGTPRGCRSDPLGILAGDPRAVGELVQFVVRRVADEVTPLLAAPPPACIVDQDRHAVNPATLTWHTDVVAAPETDLDAGLAAPHQQTTCTCSTGR